MRILLAALALALVTAGCGAVESGVGQAPTPRSGPAASPTSTTPTTPGPGRQFVPAPIDGLEVRILTSYPPRYVVGVQAGLPSGCAERGRHETSRTGDVITIRVLNSMPTGNPICTMIYGTYELGIDLGTSFVSRTTYTVRVNDKSTRFTAQ